MQHDATTESDQWLRAAARIVTLLGFAAFLGACTATNGGVSGMFAGKEDDRPDDIPADYFRRPAYCPPVQIRNGTEVYKVYERGHEEEADFIRYQATITKTARECQKTADGFTVKVGAGGRAIAGPKGGPGSLTLPVRVVVTQQSGGVVFTQLYKVPVTIAPPGFERRFLAGRRGHPGKSTARRTRFHRLRRL